MEIDYALVSFLYVTFKFPVFKSYITSCKDTNNTRVTMACTSSPPEVENGFVSFPLLTPTGNPTGWADTQILTYDCSRFYSLVDSNTQTCTSGSWMGTLPKCEYSRSTEIVFWLLVALFILLLLLLLFLLIFLCWYFCSCCGRKKNRRDEDSETGRKSRESSPRSHQDRKHSQTGTNSQPNRSEENTDPNDDRSRYHNDDKDNGSCSPCCVTFCGKRTKDNTPRGGDNQPQTERHTPRTRETNRRDTPTEHIHTQAVGARSRSPTNRQPEDDHIVDDNTEDSSGCCSGCCVTTKGRSTGRTRSRNNDDDDDEHVTSGCCGGRCCLTTEPKRKARQHQDSISDDDGEGTKSGCFGSCCKTTEARRHGQRNRVEGVNVLADDRASTQQGRETEDGLQGEEDNDEDHNSSKGGCFAGCCSTTQGRKRARQVQPKPTDHNVRDRHSQGNNPQHERGKRNRVEGVNGLSDDRASTQQGRESEDGLQGDKDNGDDHDSSKGGCFAGCCSTTQGRKGVRQVQPKPTDHNIRDRQSQGNKPQNESAKPNVKQRAFVARTVSDSNQGNNDQLVDEELQRLEEREADRKKREKEQEEELKKENKRRIKEEERKRQEERKKDQDRYDNEKDIELNRLDNELEAEKRDEEQRRQTAKDRAEEERKQREKEREEEKLKKKEEEMEDQRRREQEWLGKEDETKRRLEEKKREEEQKRKDQMDERQKRQERIDENRRKEEEKEEERRNKLEDKWKEEELRRKEKQEELERERQEKEERRRQLEERKREREERKKEQMRELNDTYASDPYAYADDNLYGLGKSPVDDENESPTSSPKRRRKRKYDVQPRFLQYDHGNVEKKKKVPQAHWQYW